MDQVAHMELKIADWESLSQDAKTVRWQVFVQEQQIPEHEEWDEFDRQSLHFVMYQHGQPIATARLIDRQTIGRVAVLKNYRGLGIGHDLMQAVINYAKQQDCLKLVLSAQSYATGFYENLGFQQRGEAYEDCGIAHIQMYLDLKTL